LPSSVRTSQSPSQKSNWWYSLAAHGMLGGALASAPVGVAPPL
jgi:hypothetical protein